MAVTYEVKVRSKAGVSPEGFRRDVEKTLRRVCTGVERHPNARPGGRPWKRTNRRGQTVYLCRFIATLESPAALATLSEAFEADVQSVAPRLVRRASA